METGTGTLNDLSLGEVLDRLAEKTPAPGAGSTAALVCSLAAALLEMTAAFDATPMGSACAVRAAALRDRALELADRELHSYEPVLRGAAAARLRSRARDARSPAPWPRRRRRRWRSPRSGPSWRASPPRPWTASPISWSGEAVVASELAEGACRAAARLVEINLAGAAGDPRLTEVAGLVKAAAQARAETLAKASD